MENPKKALQWRMPSKHNHILAIFLLLIFACHKDDLDQPKPTGNPNAGNEELTDEKKQAVYGLVEAFMNALPNHDPGSGNELIYTYLKAMPEFKNVVYEGGDIWAQFTDGTEYMIVNNRPVGSEIVSPDFTGFEGQRKAQSTKKTSNARVGLPMSDKVYLVNSLGNSFPSTRYARNVIKSFFDNKGYDVQQVNGTIENLKSIRDAGVFYFSTHGGFRKNGSDSILRIWTSDVQSDALDKKYKQELKDNILITMAAYHNIGPDGKSQSETHYAITEKFVEKYMKFSDNAMMYVDACHSYMSNSFRHAFINQSNYTGTYLGWTEKVEDSDSYTNAAFFFDRLLADNSRYATVLPESPYQRAFDIPSIFNDMVKRDIGKSLIDKAKPGEYAYLTYDPGPNGSTSLRPSIAYLLMDELTGTLNIWGSFGADVGAADRRVLIDGVEADDVYWTPEFITCKIKATGKGSAGDVVVKVRNHESHPRTLTEWRGQIKYRRPSEGSVIQEVTYTIHLRRDVDKYRASPGEKPIQVPSGMSVNFFAKDSKATYSIGGSATNKFTSGCTHTNSVRWDDLNGELPLIDVFTVPQPNAEYFVGQVEPGENGFSVTNVTTTLYKESKATYTSHYECPDSQGDNDIKPQPVKLNGLPAEFSSINLVFDQSKNIKPGALSANVSSLSGLQHGGDAVGDPQPTFKATLEWSFSTKFPPKNNAALRLAN